MVNSVGRADLLRNDGGNEHNWFQVRVVGVESNRDGVGARVELNAGGLRQIQRNQERLWTVQPKMTCTLLLGWGRVESIEQLVVRWPSGTVDRMSQLAVNQRVVIEEGRGWVKADGWNGSSMRLDVRIVFAKGVFR